jgi:multidrug efflux pump subunit AcrA (membrane-fusion protein)
MSISRRWIFPIIRLVIFLAIAIALVKLAFFASVELPKSTATPTGSISEPLSTAKTGTVLNNVSVSGSIAADPATPVKATAAGPVARILVPAGRTVKKGTAILTITGQITGTGPDAGKPKLVTVLSGASGTLSEVSVIVGQEVAVGDSVAQVASSRFSVTGTLQPEQLYRLLNKPTSATVTISGGPAPFTCTGLTIAAMVAASSASEPGSDPAAGTSGGGSDGTSMSCAVPTSVRVFNGLQATVSIPGGSAKNAIIVPVTAVEGIADVGIVYLEVDGAAPHKEQVKLGLNDGKNVQILSGLSVGDTVLEYVPGAKKADGCPAGSSCTQAAGQ